MGSFIPVGPGVTGQSTGVIAELSAFPPLAAAYVADISRAEHLDELDLEIDPALAVDFAGAELFGSRRFDSAIVADTFTAVNATNVLTATTHGLNTGDGPVQLTNAGGALPDGLEPLTDYWVIQVDADDLQLAESLADAYAGNAVDFIDDGTGTHTLTGVESQQVKWTSFGLLGPAKDGVISLADDELYSVRFFHRPVVEAYAVSATLSGAVVTTIRVHPVSARG